MDNFHKKYLAYFEKEEEISGSRKRQIMYLGYGIEYLLTNYDFSLFYMENNYIGSIKMIRNISQRGIILSAVKV